MAGEGHECGHVPPECVRRPIPPAWDVPASEAVALDDDRALKLIDEAYGPSEQGFIDWADFIDPWEVSAGVFFARRACDDCGWVVPAEFFEWYRAPGFDEFTWVAVIFDVVTDAFSSPRRGCFRPPAAAAEEIE